MALALDIARRAARAAEAAPPGGLTLSVSADVAAAFGAALRDALGAATGRAVDIVCEAAYGRAKHHVDFGRVEERRG